MVTPPISIYLLSQGAIIPSFPKASPVRPGVKKHQQKEVRYHLANSSVFLKNNCLEDMSV
jgi:hypothetical protein